jgi:hypothetical protein
MAGPIVTYKYIVNSLHGTSWRIRTYVHNGHNIIGNDFFSAGCAEEQQRGRHAASNQQATRRRPHTNQFPHPNPLFLLILLPHSAAGGDWPRQQRSSPGEGATATSAYVRQPRAVRPATPSASRLTRSSPWVSGVAQLARGLICGGAPGGAQICPDLRRRAHAPYVSDLSLPCFMSPHLSRTWCDPSSVPPLWPCGELAMVTAPTRCWRHSNREMSAPLFLHMLCLSMLVVLIVFL